jgi:hypothetical protein
MDRAKEIGKNEAKVRELTNPYQATQDPGILIERGNYLFKLRKYGQAWRDFVRATRLAPEKRGGWEGRVAVLAVIGPGNREMEKATRMTLEKIMEMDERQMFEFDLTRAA